MSIFRRSKSVTPSSRMSGSQKKKSHAIIHSASIAAAGAGAGLAQIPGSDNAIITPIQLAMAISLGKVFGIKLDESSAKAALGSATAFTVGRVATQVLAGWIPGVGNALNASTAAALTEIMGWWIANSFAEEKEIFTEKKPINFFVIAGIVLVIIAIGFAVTYFYDDILSIFS